MSLSHRLVAWGSAAKFSLAVLLAGAALVTLSPRTLAVPGDLYVTDSTANSVFVVAFDGSVSTFAIGLSQPQGIILDPSANVYVCDSGSGSVLKFTPDGTQQPVVASGLSNPIGIAFDGFNLLVAENGADVVTRIDPNGVKSTFASVTAPKGLAVKSGNTYIAHENSVLRIEADGTQTEFDVGSPTRAVAVVSDLVGSTFEDTVFVSTDSAEVDAITSDGTIVQFAPGSTLTDPNGLAFRPARFSGDTDKVGNLYVAETSMGDILQFTRTGNETSFVTSGNPNFLAFESGVIPAGKLLNISTRVDVQAGDNVGIGGFIITGDPATTKTVAIRAIGPSLGSSGVSDFLLNPLLELHEPDGSVVTNDNWKGNSQANQQIITDNGLDMYGPDNARVTINDVEAIIIANLSPKDDSVPGSGEYTAIIRGNGAGSGIALVEVYDLDDPATADSQLANISTRGFVGTGDDVLIGGTITGPVDGSDATVVVRAIGPSLANATPPVADALADPTLELKDANANTIAANDNWMDGADQQAISDAGLAPTDDAESALLATLTPNVGYTAIVSGVDGTTGVALVEIFNLSSPAAAAK